MATYESPFMNRPALFLGCNSGLKALRLCLLISACNLECSLADTIRRFSGRLSVLMPFMWWTHSEDNSGRPIIPSITKRCSFLDCLLICTRLYPYTSRPFFLNWRDTLSFSSGCSSQYRLRDSDIFLLCSRGFGPAHAHVLGLDLMPNLINRILTVLRLTPNSSAIDCMERVEYCDSSHSGSFSLSITELYHEGNRLSL